jgi:hypothetical protein
MDIMKLKVISKDNKELACSISGEEVNLVHTVPYNDGDRISLETSRYGAYCVVKLEDSMPEALVYIKGTSMEFFIPPENNRTNYSPKSFTGGCHLISARFASDEEIHRRRNLALNVYDCHENTTFYPHASANVETRGEAVFAARNAIDGMFINSSHGKYPYQSWGINRDPNAALTLDFGRNVAVDEIRLTLRADYPHDNYWTSATVQFDDGSEEVLSLVKTEKPQAFPIKSRVVQKLVLDRLIMAEGPSPFPALTQIEVWGSEI